MGKSKWVIALLFAMSLLLAGCGKTKLPETCEEPTIYIEKEGAVTVFVVGELDKDYYDLTELADMAKSDIDEYNRKNFLTGDPDAELVKVVYAKEGGSTVNVVYRFPHSTSYSSYAEGNLYYGTLGETMGLGLEDMTLKTVKGGEMLLSEGKPEYKLIVTDEKAKVICPGKVVAVSEGAECIADDAVNTASCDDMVYILLK